jgi:hypothetical protein
MRLPGVSLYLAVATRIEAVKLIPLLAGLEILAWRRQGPDRGVLWLPGAFLILLLLDTAVLAGFQGGAGARLRELFPAVDGWEASPAAREMGAWTLVKSFFSPFGAFGVLGPVAGAASMLKRGDDSLPLVVGGYLLASAFWVAFQYRIADGRHFTLLVPFVAWPAAAAVEGAGRWARIAGPGLAAACFLCLQTRIPPDTAEACRRLAQAVGTRPGPVETDVRTLGVLRLYHPDVEALPFGKGPATGTWLADHRLMREIDTALYGRASGMPALDTAPEAVVPVRANAGPVLGRLLHRLVPGRAPAPEGVSEIRLYRR